LLDLPLMTRVGLSIAVNDAHPEVRKYADWSTQLAGGFGAVREVCDLIMQSQGTLSEVLNSYLKC
jgi:3-deoxy-D-manno-octulosonate 8-phosphate phosphatase (KDO 8-P phosphatase)